jgi:Spy/CpxP family protein refolding chaperone
MLHRSKLYAAGLLAAVFAAGIAVGTGVSAAASDRREPDRREGNRGERESYATRLARELNLTPAQQDSVDRIVDGYQDSMSVMWAEMRPRMDAVRASIRTDIAALLDTAQQAQYRVYIQRSDSIRSARDAEREKERNHDRR